MLQNKETKRLLELISLIREQYKKDIKENEKIIDGPYDEIYYQGIPTEE